MSQTTTPTPEPNPAPTHEEVTAMSASVPGNVVNAANDAPSPTGFDAFMNAFGARLAAVEAVLGIAAPAIEGTVEMVAPQTAPVIATVNHFGGVIEGILGALTQAFGDKLPGLPTPGVTGNVPPTATPAA